MDGVIVVALVLGMLVVLGWQARRLRDHLYDESRYLRDRPVSDRRLKTMWVVDDE